MAKTITNNNTATNMNKKRVFIIDIIKIFGRILIPMLLFAGGLLLIYLKVAGWGIVIGFPIAVIGAGLLIFTYDEVLSKKIGEVSPRLFEPKYSKCHFCHKKVILPEGEWEEDAICPECYAKQQHKIHNKS